MILDSPELLFYNGSTLLESPVWDNTNQVLYFVSIEQEMIYGLEIETGFVKSFRTNGQVGCVVLTQEQMLLSAEKAGIYRIDPNTGERLFLLQPEKNEAMRFNDGKLDPNGRFLFGTMGFLSEQAGCGQVYSYDGTEVSTIIEGTTISNGIGFSPCSKYLYFIDTPTKKVACYRYDIHSGSVIFNGYIIEIPGPGYPDGMCVDSEGMLWIAEWEGGQVCKWNPETGKKIATIGLPCKRVTSCCLGGNNQEYLFVTTARDDTTQELYSGGLFKIKLGNYNS
jgi:sugar lactone lactonase YvrE